MQSSPSTTSSPTTAYAPTRTPAPSRAPGATTARGSIPTAAAVRSSVPLILPDLACRSFSMFRHAGRLGRRRFHWIALDHLAHQGCFRSEIAIDGGFPAQFAKVPAPGNHGNFEPQLFARNHRPAKASVIDGHEIQQFILALG